MPVTLRSPTFGSVYSIDTFTQTRRTAGGTTVQVRPSSWPAAAERHRWAFEGLSKAMIDGFLAWAETNAGLTVTLNDEHGDEWEGIIISPLIEYQQTHRNTATGTCPNNSLWRMSFEFEGVKV
jgi:hypothetical protein